MYFEHLHVSLIDLIKIVKKKKDLIKRIFQYSLAETKTKWPVGYNSKRLLS